MPFQVGQPYNALLQNGTAHQPLSNSARRPYFPDQQPQQAEQPFPQQQPLQPSVQINIQPLIKTMPSARAAPIVYSFGQADYANRLFVKPGAFGDGGRVAGTRRVSWGKAEGLDGQDDFADILG